MNFQFGGISDMDPDQRERLLAHAVRWSCITVLATRITLVTAVVVLLAVVIITHGAP